jgi:branched-chain amino acid transport system ATP-binding protein
MFQQLPRRHWLMIVKIRTSFGAEGERDYMAAKAQSMLEVRRLSAGYGQLEIVHGVELEAREGECLALLGPAGAGKTTLLRTIAGLITPMHGSILYRGENLAAVPPHARVARGIVLVPEGRRLFTGMTVRENLIAGAFTIRNPRANRAQCERVFALFPILEQRQMQVVGTLSGGEQQMCVIGRALMSQPRMILIDELSLGLAPVVVDRLVQALVEIHRSGTTLLVVEQDVRLALSFADRGYILRQGRIVKSGEAAGLLDDADLRSSSLAILRVGRGVISLGWRSRFDP